MRKNSFEFILKEIKPYTDYIYLHVKGEPMLHPNFSEYLDLAHDAGFKVNITTNGVFIDKLHEQLLIKPAIRQMNFSLHSFSENKKENYIEDILKFTKEAIDKTNIIISLRLWNFGENNGDSLEKNRRIIQLIEQAFYGENKIEENLITGKGFKIKERLYLNTDYEFEWPSLSSDYHNETGFCYALRDQIAILADGTVVPCCLDGEGINNLGNIFEQNFGEIIVGERSRAIYNGFTRHKAIEELCIKCSFKARFE